MRKLLLLSLLAPSIALANVDSVHVYPMGGTGMANNYIPLQVNYDFMISNTTDERQSWHYKATLCAQDHRCEVLEDSFHVKPHSNKDVRQTIYKQAKYLAPGTYRLTGDITIYSHKLGISKSETKYTTIQVR